MSRKALIFWGGWAGHEPESCAEIVDGILRSEGFDTRVVAGTKALSEDTLGDYDLIVPVATFMDIEEAELQNLTRTVENGTGLGGFHGGMTVAFTAARPFYFMTGAYWVAHPGDIIDYRVEITDADDPIVEGIGDFDYKSEQYYMLVDPSLEVLATTRFSGEHAYWTKGVVMPVVWKHRYGRARIFCSALGHVPAEFEHPQMREILRRGLLWAAR